MSLCPPSGDPSPLRPHWYPAGLEWGCVRREVLIEAELFEDREA
jgi:hypothetical protein